MHCLISLHKNLTTHLYNWSFWNRWVQFNNLIDCCRAMSYICNRSFSIDINAKNKLNATQQEHDVEIRSFQRRWDAMTPIWRCFDVALTSIEVLSCIDVGPTLGRPCYGRVMTYWATGNGLSATRPCKQNLVRKPSKRNMESHPMWDKWHSNPVINYWQLCNSGGGQPLYFSGPGGREPTLWVVLKWNLTIKNGSQLRPGHKKFATYELAHMTDLKQTNERSIIYAAFKNFRY